MTIFPNAEFPNISFKIENYDEELDDLTQYTESKLYGNNLYNNMKIDGNYIFDNANTTITKMIDKS